MRALFARLMIPVSAACLTLCATAQDGGSDGDWGGSAAPEINPSLLAAGLVLLVGGALILVSRRRARQTTS